MKSYFDPNPEASHWQRVAKLKEIRELSPMAQRMPLDRMEPAAVKAVESTLLQEARANAANSGRLFATAERDRAGRLIENFEGDPRAWMKPYMRPGHSVRFNKDAGTREEVVRLKAGQRVRIEG